MSEWLLPTPPPPQGRESGSARASWPPATPVSPGTPRNPSVQKVAQGKAGFGSLLQAAVEALRAEDVVKARRCLEPIMASYEAALEDASARSAELPAALAIAADLSASAEAPREAAALRRRSSQIWELLAGDLRRAGDDPRARRAEASARDMEKRAKAAELEARRVSDRVHNQQLQDTKRPGLGRIGRA